jgi:hypothetical protein
MKAIVVSETPTEKVVDRSKRGFDASSDLTFVSSIFVGVPTLIAMIAGFASGEAIIGSLATMGGASLIYLLGQGDGFNTTLRKYTGQSQTKKEFRKLLGEGETLEVGKVFFTDDPQTLTGKGYSSQRYTDYKQIATHQVRHFVKKVNGKIAFEQVITELPLQTWKHTFDELLKNDGLDRNNLEAIQIPYEKTYEGAEARGKVKEYREALSGNLSKAETQG